MSKARGLADLGNAYSDGALSNRNLIINGAMQVAQRAASVTGSSQGYITADRWYLRRTSSGVTFDSDVTSGVLTCENPSAATGFDLRHGIEWEDRFYGKTMTLTFTATTGSGTIHVDASAVDGAVSSTTSEERCHLQGTTTDIISYEGSRLVKSGDNYTFSFDVPSDADVSFTPDMLRIAIGNTSAASQSITLANVQLEVGDTATPFEHRSYGDELARCQRYYYKKNWSGAGTKFVAGTVYDTTNVVASYWLPCAMRANPSISYSNLQLRIGSVAKTISAFTVDMTSVDSNDVRLVVVSSGLSSGDGVSFRATGTGHLAFEAEL